MKTVLRARAPQPKVHPINARFARTASRCLVLAFVAACGAHDPTLATSRQALVGPNDPLPVPTDTIQPPDLIDAANHLAVGSIPMTSGVGADGQAWVSIPISVAPGRRGMEPELTLEYHSRAGNGLVGVGWSLAGFSQITPCPHRVAVDGYAGPGALCLDGEPLKSMGTNVWTTEHDRFIRILSKPKSNIDTTPIYDVYHPDGRISHYGTNGLLNRIEDRYGNTIDYTYGNENAPQSIDYTGSTTNTALTANRHVQFTYEARSDIEHVFYPVATRTLQRLKTIEIWGPDAQMKNVLLRKYILEYLSGSDLSVSNRSLLARITLSDGTNSIGSTDLSWEKGTTGFSRLDTSVTDYLSSDSSAGYMLADFNGDGFADLFYLVKDANGHPDFVVRTWDNAHADFGPINDLHLTPTKGFGGYFTFPSPGITDVRSPPGMLLWQQPAGASQPFPLVQNLMTLNGDINVAQGSFFRFDPTADTGFLADFDGDGLADVITGWTMAGPQSIFQFNRNLAQTPAAFDNPVNIPVPAAMGKGKTFIPGLVSQFRGVDFNGDGRQGFITCYPDNPGSPAYVVTKDGATFYNPGVQFTHPLVSCAMISNFNGQYMFVDFNNDGIDDSFWLAHNVNGSDQAVWNLVLGRGVNVDGAAHNQMIDTTYYPRNAKYAFLDYNEDEHPDVVITRPNQPIVIQTFNTNEFFGNDAATPLTVATLPVSIFSGADNSIQTGDVNGDGLTDFVVLEGGRFVVYQRQGKKADMLTQIVDGVSATTTFTYQPTNSAAVYTPTSSYLYPFPMHAVNGGQWVVSNHVISSAAGKTQSYFYKYEGAIEDVQRGFVGFNARTIDWLRPDSSHVEERLVYDNSRQKNVDPFAGIPTSDTVTEYAPGAAFVHQTVRQQSLQMVYNSDFASYFVYPSAVTTTEYNADAKGAPVQVFTETLNVSSVDNAGHVLAATLTKGAGESISVATTYAYDYNNWIVDQPVLETMISTPPRACPTCRVMRQTRTKAWKYDGKGSVEWDIIEPSVDANGVPSALPQPQPDGVQTLFTHYIRDPDGQIAQVTHDLDFTATAKQRVSSFYRDGADRVFVTRTQNKLGHVVHVATHPGLGLLAAMQDQNGAYSHWQYDTFGRPHLSAPAGAEPTTFTYAGFDPAHMGGAKLPLELHEKGAGGAEIITQLDLVGNVLHQKLNARNDGRLVVQDFTYDDAGRLVQHTPAHFDSRTPPSLVDTWQYDAAGRLLRAKLADGRTQKHAYTGATGGLHVDHWDADPGDALVSTSTTVFDLSRRPVTHTQHARAKDGRPARDLTTQLRYSWFDQLASIGNMDGSTFVFYGRDREGRLVDITDPSSGERSFSYNAFGDTVSEQINGENRLTDPDDLGRPHTLQTRDGTTTWTWDTATNGLGLLGSLSSPTGVTTKYAYDGNGQLVDATENVGGVDYDITYEPDAYGRVHRIYYPPVNGARFTVRYEYAHGALQNIYNDTTGDTLWTLLETDAAGNATNPSGAFPQYRLGKALDVHYTENAKRPRLLQEIDAAAATKLQAIAYDFDSKGRVSKRNDTLHGLSEGFDYDELDRLEHWTVGSASGPSKVRFDYSDLANYTGRTYEQGAGTNRTFQYTGERGAGPYAITNDGSRDFSYDAEGNQSQAGSRIASFTAYGLPLSFTQGTTSDAFRYDGDGYRADKTVSINGAVDDTVLVGGLFRKHTAGGASDYAYAVPGPNGPITWVAADATGKSTGQWYLLPDHLGSIDTIVDGSGGVELRKFDPFGNRFDPQNPLGPAPPPSTPVPFGFTGHEHDWDLGLINMKGRVYDPSIGRFLSPDRRGGTWSTAAGLNSYGYVLDNPETLVDPSGFYEDDPTDPGSWGSGDPCCGGGGGGGSSGTGGGGGSGSGGGTIQRGPAAPAGNTVKRTFNPADASTLRARSSTLVRLGETEQVPGVIATFQNDMFQTTMGMLPPSVADFYRVKPSIGFGGSGLAAMQAMDARVGYSAGVAFSHLNFYIGKFTEAYMMLTAAFGELNTIAEGTALIKAPIRPQTAPPPPQVVYRALNAKDAERLAAGEGLQGKAPAGKWTAAQHIANSGPGTGGAAENSAWISTTRNLEVARGYDSGHGIVAIDLNKVSSYWTEVWKFAPRVNGVQGLPYFRSIWAEEVTVFQDIVRAAILGKVK